MTKKIPPLGKKQLPPRIRKFRVRSYLASPGTGMSIRARGIEIPSASETTSRKEVFKAISRMAEHAAEAAQLTKEHYSVEVSSTSTGWRRGCSTQVDKHGYWYPWRCF